MHISARADYAMRAVLVLGSEGAVPGGGPSVTSDRIAAAQGLPLATVSGVLAVLVRAGILRSQRGAEGGFRLARAPETIQVAEVLRAVDGHLADVHGLRPEDTEYIGPAKPLVGVWVAARAAMRHVFETVTVADLLADRLPPDIAALIEDPDTWASRRRI